MKKIYQDDTTTSVQMMVDFIKKRGIEKQYFLVETDNDQIWSEFYTSLDDFKLGYVSGEEVKCFNPDGYMYYWGRCFSDGLGEVLQKHIDSIKRIVISDTDAMVGGWNNGVYFTREMHENILPILNEINNIRDKEK